MIKSMTGFASLSREDTDRTIGVTVRAVNHRYLDIQFRIPQSLAAVEPRLRTVIQQRIARGRIELGLSVQFRRPPAFEVDLNEPFVDALAGALERARERGLVSGALAPGDLLRFPQALAIRERAADAEEGPDPAVLESVERAVIDALDELETMRVREGGYLRADLDGRRAFLADLVANIAAAADSGRAMLEQRLAERVRELAFDFPTDATAVGQEIVRFAARSDITEEIVRFRGHLAHWAALSDSAEPCGRKLDFLLQEMNREVNTIGSKAEGAGVPELIVAAKAELEKMREQVQNVE